MFIPLIKPKLDCVSLREITAGVTLFFLIVLVESLALSTNSHAAVAGDNPIVAENQQSGTDRWQLGLLPGTRKADDTTNQIRGYASATSVNKGGQINFHITVNPSQTYSIDVYRIGWYGGQGGR